MATPILLFLVGSGTGLVAPLLGIGGAIIMIPLLSLAVGLPVQTAVGLSSLGIIAGSISASYNNLVHRVFNPVSAIHLAIPASLAGFIGGTIGLRLTGPWLQLLFSFFLQFVLIFVLVRRYHPAFRDRSSPAAITTLGQAMLVAIVFAASLIGGMVGIGGGSVVVPVLFLLSPLSWKQSVATSSMILGFSAFVPTLLRMQAGYVPANLAISLLLGVQLGARLGRPLLQRLPADLLRVFFVIVVSGSAAGTLYSSLRSLL